MYRQFELFCSPLQNLQKENDGENIFQNNCMNKRFNCSIDLKQIRNCWKNTWTESKKQCLFLELIDTGKGKKQLKMKTNRDMHNLRSERNRAAKTYRQWVRSKFLLVPMHNEAITIRIQSPISLHNSVPIFRVLKPHRRWYYTRDSWEISVLASTFPTECGGNFFRLLKIKASHGKLVELKNNNW